jgi:hypothetical protein
LDKFFDDFLETLLEPFDCFLPPYWLPLYCTGLGKPRTLVLIAYKSKRPII